ncbi:hypothetical protein HAX54_006505, partial [Datura stramonium]|nr:hypothetical protein [Datura stramonium]
AKELTARSCDQLVIRGSALANCQCQPKSQKSHCPSVRDDRRFANMHRGTVGASKVKP